MNSQSADFAQSTVFFDLETGGLTDEHPDIQLAAVAVNDEDMSIDAEFQVKIQFDESKADPEALALNHYDRAIWEREAISESLAVRKFADFLSRYKCVRQMSKRTGAPYWVAKLAGHNAATFDMPRLRRMFQRNANTFLAADPRVFDTVQLAMWHLHGGGGAFPENYKLSTLAKWFGVEAGSAHDALADVKICVDVARCVKGLCPLQEIQAVNANEGIL